MDILLIVFGIFISEIVAKETPNERSIFTKRFLNRTNISNGRSSHRNIVGSRDYSYHYEVPMKNYLPPFGDEYPQETTTQIVFGDEPIPPQGYVYEAPRIPFDELRPPVSHDEPILPQGYLYEAPRIPFDELRPPVSHDELPDVEIPNRDYLPTRSAFGAFENRKNVPPLHLEVNEMHCYETLLDGRFQALLTLKSKNENVPVFENAKGRSHCEINAETKPPLFDTNIRINISKNDFVKCGIKDCSSGEHKADMCVKLRFPTVAKMRLPEDPVLILQCRTQDKIASHVKHLNFDVDNSV